MKSQVLEEVRQLFRPEFLNRLDLLIVFRQLSPSDLIQILGLEIAHLVDRLKGRNIQLKLNKEAVIFLTVKGHDPLHGARPMRRTPSQPSERLPARSSGVEPNRRRGALALELLRPRQRPQPAVADRPHHRLYGPRLGAMQGNTP